MTRFASAIIFFLLSPATVNGFQFDSWTSGISVREAMAIARDKDIPILKEGIVSINKHFNPDVMKYVATAHEFYYNADLLGEHAKVNLTFTPESKFLSRVKIQWSPPFKDRSFRIKLFQLLTDKYGTDAKKDKQLFFKTFSWKIDNTNRVSTRTGRSAILVEYVDLIAHGQEQKELKKRQQEIWRQSKDKDASKF